MTIVTPPLVGLCGLKGSGKDTLAAALVKNHGYVRVAFADRLKAVAIDTDPYVFYRGGYTRLAAVVENIGWDAAKQHADVRRFLQYLGMAVRDNLDAEAWINAVFSQVVQLRSDGHPVVITDVRMLNEVDLVRDLYGNLIQVKRPGINDDDTHISENEWKSAAPNIVFTNRGGLADVDRAAAYIANKLLGRS